MNAQTEQVAAVRRVTFSPLVTVVEQADGSRVVEWDWTGALLGEVTDAPPFLLEGDYAEETSVWLDGEIAAGRIPA